MNTRSVSTVTHLDYVLVRPDIEVTRVQIGDSWLARLASDHRPLLTEIKMTGRH